MSVLEGNWVWIPIFVMISAKLWLWGHFLYILMISEPWGVQIYIFYYIIILNNLTEKNEIYVSPWGELSMNINFRDDICKTVALSPFFSFFYSDFSWFFHFFVQLQKFFKNHSYEIHRISWARWNRNFILFKNHRNEVLTQINGLAARADFLPRGRFFFSKKSDFVNYFF